MLIAENVDFFADEAYFYEIKWDGERCVAFLDPGNSTELRNKRNVRMLPKIPELSNIHRQVAARCILDGELVCIVDGKPDFSVIQHRSLLSDKYKIELEAKQHPAVFIAFDCLYYDGRDLTMCPLAERREYLRRAVTTRTVWQFPAYMAQIRRWNFFNSPRCRAWRGSLQRGKTACIFKGNGQKPG